MLIVSGVGATAGGVLIGLVLSGPGATATAEVLAPLISICVAFTLLVLWTVASHSVVVRAPEMALLSTTGATHGQLARMVVVDALVTGTAAGAAGGLISLVLVGPAGAVLVGAGALPEGFVGRPHIQVVLWCALLTAPVVACGSLGAARATGRTRRPPRWRWTIPLRRSTRLIAGSIALPLAVAGLVQVANTTTVASVEIMGVATGLAVALCLLAPALLWGVSTGSRLMARGVTRRSGLGLVAAAETQHARQSAPVVAATGITLVVVSLYGLGEATEATARTALLDGTAGMTVLTSDAASVEPAQFAAIRSGLTGQELVIGRTHGRLLLDGEPPIDWPLGVVEPAQLLASWAGEVHGDLTAFGPGAAVVGRTEDFDDNPIGSTIRIVPRAGSPEVTLELEVVASVSTTGPWGVLVSPVDARSLPAPTGHDVLTPDPEVAQRLADVVQGASGGERMRVEPVSTWIAAMPVEEVTGGSGSGSVPLLTAIPVLLCAALGTASVAMAHTRRHRQRQILVLAGAQSWQIAVLDQMQALLPLLIGLSAGVLGSAAVLQAVEVNVQQYAQVALPSQLPWSAVASIVAVVLVPAACVTAAQSLLAPRWRTR
jgi:hypothetical protein